MKYANIENWIIFFWFFFLRFIFNFSLIIGLCVAREGVARSYNESKLEMQK